MTAYVAVGVVCALALVGVYTVVVAAADAWYWLSQRRADRRRRHPLDRMLSPLTRAESRERRRTRLVRHINSHPRVSAERNAST